jgi:hypothetical protein
MRIVYCVLSNYFELMWILFLKDVELCEFQVFTIEALSEHDVPSC